VKLSAAVVRRLIAVEEALGAREPAYLAEALRRTEDAWERLGSIRVLLSDQSIEQLHAVLQERLDMLVENARLGMLPGAPMVRFNLAYAGVLADLLERMPPDLRADVVANLARNLVGGEWGSEFGGLCRWLWALAAGDFALPSGLTAEALGRVLRVLVGQPPAGLWMFFHDCGGCGLALPLPASLAAADAFFPECPHCGTGTK
jgi:hypothetical protein